MDQTAAMMYGNYNGLNSLGGLGTGGLPNGLNNGMGNFGNNGMLGSNGMLGGGGGNMFAPSFGGLNALIGGRNFRNRIGYSRDSGNSRLQSNSMLDCGLLNPRPCGNDVQKLRTVGAGTAWENSHDSRRR
jgi:hypothetical protein